MVSSKQDLGRRCDRDSPFDGLRSPDWVVLEGILATVEAGIVDLACRYAQHSLDVVDPPRAEWAARQGLRVSPYDQQMVQGGVLGVAVLADRLRARRFGAQRRQ